MRGAGHLIARLERTPDALDSLLRDTPDALARRRPKPGSFSAYHAVAHLIIGERTDWVPRLRHILEHGDSVAFPPFAHTSTIEPESGPSTNELLDEFRTLRRASIGALGEIELNDETLALRGLHPELGPVSVSELLHTWATHDLHHTAQICACLARSSEHAVGPWSAYLGILGDR